MSAVEITPKAIEVIGEAHRPVAYIVRNELVPRATQFITPPELPQQVGFVAYPAGGTISRHRHRPIERRITGTSEVLVVRQGQCEVDLFDDRGEPLTTRELRQGDVLILVSGGHGFRMLEDTVLLEVKQGPYTGLDEKERF